MPIPRHVKEKDQPTSWQVGIRIPDSLYQQVIQSPGNSTNAKVLNLLASALANSQQKAA